MYEHTSDQFIDLHFLLFQPKRRDAEEGDSRYIAPELLDGNFSKAADIFSLGVTMLELITDLELHANGPLWQELRQGIIPPACIQRKYKKVIRFSDRKILFSFTDLLNL